MSKESASREDVAPLTLSDIRDLCRSFKLEHRAHTKAYRGFLRLEYLLTGALSERGKWEQTDDSSFSDPLDNGGACVEWFGNRPTIYQKVNGVVWKFAVPDLQESSERKDS